MARNAGFGFDTKDILGGQALDLEPFPDGGLPDATGSSESGLRPGSFDCLEKGFIWCDGVGHDYGIF